MSASPIYHNNIKDIRNSSAIRVFTELSKKGIAVEFYDPFIDKIKIGSELISGIPNKHQLTGRLSEFDIVVVMVDHDGVDYLQIKKNLSHLNRIFLKILFR